MKKTLKNVFHHLFISLKECLNYNALIEDGQYKTIKSNNFIIIKLKDCFYTTKASLKARVWI